MRAPLAVDVGFGIAQRRWRPDQVVDPGKSTSFIPRRQNKAKGVYERDVLPSASEKPFLRI